MLKNPKNAINHVFFRYFCEGKIGSKYARELIIKKTFMSLVKARVHVVKFTNYVMCGELAPHITAMSKLSVVVNEL